MNAEIFNPEFFSYEEAIRYIMKERGVDFETAREILESGIKAKVIGFYEEGMS